MLGTNVSGRMGSTSHFSIILKADASAYLMATAASITPDAPQVGISVNPISFHDHTGDGMNVAMNPIAKAQSQSALNRISHTQYMFAIRWNMLAWETSDTACLHTSPL